MDVMAGTSRRTVGRALALGGATAACGVAALALAARVNELATRAGAARVDEMVELAVLAAGVLALAWLAASAAVAATCLAVRCAGRTWHGGEAWVRRFAPAVVRRALVVALAAGMVAGGATGAFAAGGAPTTSSPAVVTAGTGDPGGATPGGRHGQAATDDGGLDLGWVVTSGAAPATAVPSADAAPPADAAPATDGGPVAAGTPTWRPPGSPSSSPSNPSSSPPATADPALAPTVPAPADTPAGTQPDAPADTRARTTPAGEREPAGEPATITVARGDSLWAIAARHLPAGATDAQIAAAWPSWYAANAAVIGPDPGLILPGQVLAVPAGVTR